MYQQVQQHLRIRFGMKLYAGFLQPATQRFVIIDFAIINKDIPFCFILHGLVACRRRVNDGKPPVAHANNLIIIHSLKIRAT